MLLNLRSFTYRSFSSVEIENAKWPKKLGIEEGAMHSGLIIVSCVVGSEPQLHSFSTSEGLKQTSSPTLPKGFFIHSISIDKNDIYIAGCSKNAEYPWVIHVWNRETLGKVTQVTVPTLFENLDVPDEWIEQMVVQNNPLVAVTAAGRLFYWNNFKILPDQIRALTDDQTFDERHIDTIYLNHNCNRAVVMSLMGGSEVAMVLDGELSLDPAYCSKQKENSEHKGYYLRVSTDCQTAVRITQADHSNHIKPPQLDIYTLSDSEPLFGIEPLSESLNAEFGPFTDIWINKYSLVYFGADSVVQVRCDNDSKETDENDDAVTSSHYVMMKEVQDVPTSAAAIIHELKSPGSIKQATKPRKDDCLYRHQTRYR